MSLLSRFNAWFSARQEGGGVSTRLNEDASELSTQHLPNATAPSFRRRYLEAITKTSADSKPTVYTLDPTIQLLVIPNRNKADPEKRTQLNMDLDEAMKVVHASGRRKSALTWTSLVQSRPQYEPSYHTWGKDCLHRFNGEIGLIFFADIDAITQATFLSVQNRGFSPRLDHSKEQVTIRDGNFEIRLRIDEILSEALWTGRGPMAIIHRSTRILAAEFRLHHSLLSSLKRRFPNFQFEADHEGIHIRNTENSKKVDYRKLAASIRRSGISSAAWVDSILMEDLFHLEGSPSIMLRSLAYLKAWPDALAKEEKGHALVAVRTTESNRAVPVLRTSIDTPSRFNYYDDESRVALTRATFKIFVHSMILDESNWAICILGDRAAGLLLDRRLIRGLLEAILPVPTVVEAYGVNEDHIILTTTHLPDHVLDTMRSRAKLLEEDLFDDSADALNYRSSINVPLSAAGCFEITLVNKSYFALRDRGEQKKTIQPGAAAHIRSMALRSLGRKESAIAFLATALRYEHDNGDYLLALGELYLELDKPTKAIPLLEKATIQSPTSAETANALGLAHLALSNSVAASAAFEEAVKLNPTDATQWINLGRSYIENHLFSKAHECLDRALAISPDSANAHASMAILCQKTGDKKAARSHAFAALITQSAGDEDAREMKKLLKVLTEDDNDSHQ